MAKFIVEKSLWNKQRDDRTHAVLDSTNISFGQVFTSCSPQAQVADGIRFLICVQKCLCVSQWRGQIWEMCLHSPSIQT